MDEREMECKKERIFENIYITIVDVKSKKILSMKVTNEHVHDSKALPELVENIIESDSVTAIGKLFADGAYEGNDIFRYLPDNGILPGIKVRKNAQVRLKTGHILRNLSVISQKNDLQRWKDSVIWKKMDCRNSVFFYKKNVWRVCLLS
jgi:hypothetical protein